MRRYFIAFPVLLALLTACGGQKTGGQQDEAPADSQQTEEVAMPKAADELFDDFIFNFAGNPKLQIERVAFPLPAVENGKEKRLTRAQWKMESFFMRQGYYTLLFDDEHHMEVVKDTSIHHAVVEKINLADQTVRQYVFDRRKGLWMLTAMKTIRTADAQHATFLTFYHQFATDKDFQQRHLAKTVKFVGPDPDDDFSQMEGIITRDSWSAFAPELPANMLYNIVYGEPKPEGDTMLFVLRGIANGLELQMSFERKGGNWKLTKLST